MELLAEAEVVDDEELAVLTQAVMPKVRDRLEADRLELEAVGAKEDAPVHKLELRMAREY